VVESPLPLGGTELTRAISASMVELYGRFYGHDRTTAATYMNDNTVVCILEDILTSDEDAQIAAGASGQVIDGRVAFQSETQDAFTAEIERLTGRRVVAFMSANQTAPGIACELFFLELPPARDPGLRP
jgi:uncharacterized protein YbcI